MNKKILFRILDHIETFLYRFCVVQARVKEKELCSV